MAHTDSTMMILVDFLPVPYLFEVPGCLQGGRVTVYFMPWDLSRVYYGQERLLAKPLDRNANAKRFQHPNSTIKSEGNND